ncbi:hypothetical protein KU710_23630, partial [Salmonella enterica subsp. enterica serovar Give]|nr:hypothetical protein [Salmonella enterica subsp. enterica serovar Give]
MKKSPLCCYLFCAAMSASSVALAATAPVSAGVIHFKGQEGKRGRLAEGEHKKQPVRITYRLFLRFGAWAELILQVAAE